MAQAKKGDTVKVHYTGRLTTGEIFDSSEASGSAGEPLQFTIGNGDVISGFETAVLGMAPGEKKTVTIPVDQAYGERVDEMIAEIEREFLPPGSTPEMGQQYEVTQDNGEVFHVTVTGLTETTVTLDANHPLAGRELVFDISLVEIC
ncbi:peptidyl-prolyl cis-trans isomerase [Geotalea uraniireducens]|uniref:Peptidyl-prolyl cis-trans isomerase n=1 Tax=Geotalea uraniireducens TaxID=351604 RepID=A0ABM8EG94_9BACT|nr:peptidylprolyl isomerase [Geotalea uraniireducens]BDV41421.1 peptidyl-prolyl cis-trans isomerase [Geotalea uraniireducens]